MYSDNIYIANHEEIEKLSGDIGVQLDKFDDAHGLEYSALARAQYKHWREIETGADLMSAGDKHMLEINGYDVFGKETQ